MPTFRVTGPDGKSYRVNTPSGATKDQAIAYVAERYYGGGKTKRSAIEDIPVVGGILAPVADIPLKAVEGLAGVSKTFTDVFGADNTASDFLENIATGANELTSSGSREDAAISAREMKEAEGKGAWEEIKAAGRAFARSPLDTAASLVGSAAPFAAATAVSGGIAPALALGAISSAGMIKGDIYDAVLQKSQEAGIPLEQAQAIAERAQEYGGKNLDQIALGAAIGAVANATGIPRQLSRLLGSKAAETVVDKVGDRIAARVVENRVEKGIARRAGEAFAEEALPEGIQAGQERYAQNIAQQREGYDVDPMAGVIGQAAFEGLAGGVFGGGLGALKTPGATKGITDEDAKALEDAVNTFDANPTGDTEAALLDRLVTTSGMTPAMAKVVIDNRRARAEEAAKAEAERTAAREEAATEPDIGAPPEWLETPPASAYEADVGAQAVVEDKQSSAILQTEKIITDAGVPVDTQMRDRIRKAVEDAQQTNNFGAAMRAFVADTIQRAQRPQPNEAARAKTILDSDAAIRKYADGVGIDEQEAIERLEARLGTQTARAPYEPAPVLPAAATLSPTAKFAQQTAREPFDESQYPPITEDDFYYPDNLEAELQERGRPRKDAKQQLEAAGQESLFGALPTQEEQRLDKREEIMQQKLAAPAEERLTLQQQQIEEQARQAAKWREAQQDRLLDELDSIQKRLDTKEEGSQDKYSVSYDPEDSNPYKITGADGYERISAKTIEEFKQAVEAAMDDDSEDALFPYEDLTTGSGQTVEQGRERDDTIATAMSQELIGLVNDARNAGLIDNLERSNLLGLIQRPEYGKENDYLGNREADARAAIAEYRNAKNDMQRKAAQAKLDVINEDIVRSFQMRVGNPIRSRLRGMVENRIGKLKDAQAKQRAAKLQVRLGEMALRRPTQVAEELRKAPEEVATWEATGNALEKRMAKISRLLNKMRQRPKRDMFREASIKDAFDQITKELDLADAQLGRSLERDERYQAAKKALADLRKQVNEERTAWREATIARKEARAPDLMEQALTEDPDAEEAQKVQAGVEGKSVTEAADWLAKYSPNQLDRTIARQVGSTLRLLERLGVKFDLKVVHLKDTIPKALFNARGLFQPKRSLDEVNTVWLNGADVTGKVGVSYRTALHELIHAATVGAFRRVQEDKKKFTGTRIGQAVSDLQDVANAFVRHFNARVKEAQAGGAPLTEFEQAIFNRNINATQNFEEVIAWGLSSRQMQDYLMGIPYYGKQTAWGKFVEALRSLFGLAASSDTALAELLRATEVLMTTPEAELASVYNVKPPKQAETLFDLMESTNRPDTSRATSNKLEQGMDVSSVGKIKTDMSQTAYDLAGGLKDMFAAHDGKTFVAALKENMAWIGEPTIKKVLPLLPTTGIVDWAKEKFDVEVSGVKSNELQDIVKAVAEMQNTKLNLLKAADKIAKKLRSFVEQSPEADKALARAQSMSRINETSPELYKSLDDAMQNNDALVGISKLVLKNSNDKAKAQAALDTIKAETVAHRAASPAVVRAKAELAATAIDKKKADRLSKQYATHAVRVRDTMEAWEELGKHKGGHAVYKLVRQYYEDMFNAELALLDHRIESFPDPTGRKRLREVRAELMAKAGEVTEGQKASDLYHDLPAQWFPKDYFPFMREGQYWLRVKEDKKRNIMRGFYTYNTASERAAAQRKLAQQMRIKPDDEVFVKGLDVADLAESFKTDDAMMQKVFEELNALKSGASVGKVDVQNVINEVYQIWLMSSPERSVRRRFLRSEEVPGFSQNTLLHFEKQATSYSNQISKLAHASGIKALVKGAKENLDGAPPKDRQFMEAVIVEMDKRIDQELNPKPQGTAVNLLNRFSFVYYLSGGATALTQLTSIPIRTVPRLWKDFGYKEGTRMWLKYMKVWQLAGLPKLKDTDAGVLERAMPGLDGSSLVKNNPLLKRAFAAGDARNVLDTTATVLAESERAVPKGKMGTTQKGLALVADTLGFMFSASENISRQTSYLMAFELKYEQLKGKPEEARFNEAVEYAVGIVTDTLGDYGSFERPSLLKSDLFRAITLFKMYAIAQTRWMLSSVKSIWRSGKGAAKGDKAAAAEFAGLMREVSGVLMMAGMFGGLAGMPLYTAMTYAIMAAFGNAGDDDDDVRDMIGKDPRVARDPDLFFRAWMKEKFGDPMVGIDGRPHRLGDLLVNGPISELADMNIGSRTSMDLYGMWFRDVIEGDSGWGTFTNFIASNVAGVSLIKNFFDAKDDLENGDMDRALQKMFPAFFRSWLSMEQMQREGYTNRKGDTVMSPDEFSTLNKAAAAIGFRPMRLSEWQDYTVTRAKNDKAIDKERTRIMQEFSQMILSGTASRDEVSKFVADKVTPFNRRYPHPDFLITMDSLERSLKSAISSNKKEVRGMPVTKKAAVQDIEAAKPFMPVR